MKLENQPHVKSAIVSLSAIAQMLHEAASVTHDAAELELLDTVFELISDVENEVKGALGHFADTYDGRIQCDRCQGYFNPDDEMHLAFGAEGAYQDFPGFVRCDDCYDPDEGHHERDDD